MNSTGIASTIPILKQRWPTGRLAGWLLLLAAITSCIGALTGLIGPLVPGTLAWCAGLLLFRRLGGLQRGQVLLMLAVGGSGLVTAALHGEGIRYLARAIYGSHVIIAMLVAVGFLRLVAVPAAGESALPQGRRALWKTLLGTHLFGAAINFSALTIIGDRLHSVRPLTPAQAILLSRGFGLASVWSPFFVAMGVALTLAPGAGLMPVSLGGLAVALPALLLVGWLLQRMPEAERFAGYPMKAEALRVPLALVLIVMGGHALLPRTGILTLITLGALLLPLLVLLYRDREQALPRYRRHIEQSVPGMSGELLLFLAAGVLTSGVSALVHFSGFSLSLSHYGAEAAAGLVALSAVAAIVGIHPVITIGSIGGMLPTDNPDLLALSAVMSWSLGVILSPCSGMHLAMQGRFGISGFRFLVWNWRFCALLYALDCLVLFAFDRLGG